MNQVITEVPFGEGTIDAHMDTSSGEMEMETGHIEGADLKVTLDYVTAKAILVDGNPQAGMHGRQDQSRGQYDQADAHAGRPCRPDGGRGRQADPGDHGVGAPAVRA